MKIISFGDSNYIPYVISGYRNLKSINKHHNFTIYCHERDMIDKIKQIEPLCDAQYYPSHYDNDYVNNEYVHNGLLQFKKIKLLQDCVDNYKKVFYYDCDVIIFDDFISDIEQMLNHHNIVYKLYRQLNRFNTDEIINLVNSGTLGVNKSSDSDLLFNFFNEKAKTYPTPTLNMEEYILTDFYNNCKTNSCLISDKLNLVNSHDCVYSYEEIKTLEPKSFHPTYSKKGYDITKEMVTDPIFWNTIDISKLYTKIELAKKFNKWFYE